MAHFAKIDENNIVVDVIYTEYDNWLDSPDVLPGNWIKTSYRTKGGVHLDGGTPLRKNFASIGFTYDANKDAFIGPQPFNSWILNNETCLWEAPTPKPQTGNYYWDEQTTSWIELVLPDNWERQQDTITEQEQVPFDVQLTQNNGN